MRPPYRNPLEHRPRASHHAAPKLKRFCGGELVFDKFVDFVLIFVGLFAATALQRHLDAEKDRDEYVALLQDFKRELDANQAQEASIAEKLGDIEVTVPGENLGPMKTTFERYFAEVAEDEAVIRCLHDEFARTVRLEEKKAKKCHTLYAHFEKSHDGQDASFIFKPAILTPFYRYEVWEMYIANGIRIFRNKDLAVKLGEIYSNARMVERQVADIEATYNDAFMTQVGRTAATDMELAEIVHDEEQAHTLSSQNQTQLIHVSEAIKDEHYATTEVQRILELKVERMKNTVLLMRSEIEAVKKAIDEELTRVDG